MQEDTMQEEETTIYDRCNRNAIGTFLKRQKENIFVDVKFFNLLQKKEDFFNSTVFIIK